MIEASESNGRVFLKLRHPAPHQVEITAAEAVALARQLLALSCVRAEQMAQDDERAPVRELMANFFPEESPTDPLARTEPGVRGGTLPLPPPPRRGR
jgi:hypothetical protein